MHALETYLQDLRATRSSGAAVKETSYYPALANLLNEVGKTLKPKVRCIVHLQDTGGGIPDGGLFTEEQIRHNVSELLAGATPARGAIEAKPASADAWKIAESKQVKEYWSRYRQVLVTNYRDFLLVGADAEGNRYRLARDEQDFWRKAAHPRAAADQQGESFEEFLKRVMLYQASLATPRDLAWFLASYAREAKFRVETGELPALAGIRAALEEALGLRFEGARGDHFFRSTLIQTLFYGIFSAWVLWSKSHTPANKKIRFEWRMSAQYLRVPILRKLFYEVAEPGQLETLNLPEVLDWAGAVLNRVDRASFFANFEEGHAVQYFYEPFLEAFDPELRKDLGVWYTPTEVVKYMVARVDAELRNTLGVEDGLADPNVYILDPCCGTGAYLVEVLRKIAETATSAAEAADRLEVVASKKAGLLGMSGLSNDMRALRDAIDAGNAKARLAVDKFNWTIAKWVGGFFAELGGLDMLVFTGGIGEYAIHAREEICAGLGALGIILDPVRNNSTGKAIISAENSPVTVGVIPTAEDLMIVNHVVRLLGV